VDPERLYSAETDPEQAASAKPPYRDVRISGQLEGRFLFRTALSKHLVPFSIAEPPLVFLPIEEREGAPRVFTAEELRNSGWRAAARWMAEVEKVWDEKRGDKAERQTVYQWLDYTHKLSDQTFGSRFLALYNAAGTNLCAAALDREDLSERFVVDHKLYWAPCRSLAEADYVASILNSAVMNELIKPFQSLGLLGERDIHKKVLEAPIPLFDAAKPAHAELARLGAAARAEVGQLVSRGDLPESLARRRALVRKSAAATFDLIDKAVRKLIDL
jgi:hypothetical protein